MVGQSTPLRRPPVRARNPRVWARKRATSRPPALGVTRRMMRLARHCACHGAGYLLPCMGPVVALLEPREMSDLSPQRGPKRTLITSLSPTSRFYEYAPQTV